jgi:hypothetical protein
MNILRSLALLVLPLAMIALAASEVSAADKAADKADSDGWISLFDGKTLNGWKANEHPENWQVKDGAITATGQRSHLFYVGDDEEHPPQYKSFQFKADVMTTPGSNSGIYFHTDWLEEKKHQRFPQTGFEAQVNNSHRDPVRTASIYHLLKNLKAPAKDNEWFTEEIVVDAKKKNIKTFVNGQLIADYTEPQGKTGTLEVISQGTFAFQAHDPKSTTYFKNIRVKPLD